MKTCHKVVFEKKYRKEYEHVKHRNSWFQPCWKLRHYKQYFTEITPLYKVLPSLSYNPLLSQENKSTTTQLTSTLSVFCLDSHVFIVHNSDSIIAWLVTWPQHNIVPCFVIQSDYWKIVERLTLYQSKPRSWPGTCHTRLFLRTIDHKSRGYPKHEDHVTWTKWLPVGVCLLVKNEQDLFLPALSKTAMSKM